MFVSETPDNIEQLNETEIAKLLSSTTCNVGPKARVQLIKMLFSVLGFNLSNDMLFMLASEPRAKLCLAPAGGGKTTGANLQILLEKITRPDRKDTNRMIRGNKVLCLVYNDHNVNDFAKRHKQLVSQLNMANIKGLNIDDELQVATMHSFCNMWRKEYAVETNTVGGSILHDYEAKDLMDRAINLACNKMGAGEPGKISAVVLCSLYTYKKETLLDYDNLESTDKFIDAGISIDLAKEIFEFYEKLKGMRHKFDFTDMLYSVYVLLRDNPSILKHVQKFYEYVVADEVQDFTPLMFEILRLLVSNGTPLMCIGDEDQSIYNFRGADLFNTLDFHNRFEDGKVYLLSTNRRCRRAILDVAIKTIETNQMRFNKKLLGNKDGGTVKFIPYETVSGEVLNVVNQIKNYDEHQLRETVICTRNKEGSILLSQELAEAGIPFHVLSGYHAYSHELYRHVMDVLNILNRPYDSYAQLNLYKILPLKREQLQSILGYDSKKEKFSDSKEKKHFAQIDYGPIMKKDNFREVMATLITITKMVKTRPMREYFPTIFEQIKRYFWITKKTYNSNPFLDNLFEERVQKYFNSDMILADFIAAHSKKTSFCRKNQEYKKGLTISTFHGLKGLEFDTVFLLNLNNDEFPGYANIDRRPYPDDLKLALKETETRLFYVAVTRARDTLFLYYEANNPSIYVRNLMEQGQSVQTEVQEEQTTSEDMRVLSTFGHIEDADSGDDILDSLMGDLEEQIVVEDTPGFEEAEESLAKTAEIIEKLSNVPSQQDSLDIPDISEQSVVAESNNTFNESMPLKNSGFLASVLSRF